MPRNDARDVRPQHEHLISKLAVNRGPQREARVTIGCRSEEENLPRDSDMARVKLTYPNFFQPDFSDHALHLLVFLFGPLPVERAREQRSCCEICAERKRFDP